MNTLMKEKANIPTLRFFEFDEAWNMNKFGHYYDFISTNSYSRNDLSYENGVVYNIHYGDIHTKFKSSFKLEDEYVPKILPQIDISRITEERFVQEGDVLIADASEDYSDIGKSIEAIDLNMKTVLSGLHTIQARQKTDETLTGFAAHSMQSPNIRKQMMYIAQGTKVLGVSATRVGKLIYPLPTLPEQEKIAGFLGAVDEKIGELSRKKELLIQYKTSSMQKLFSQEIRFKDGEGNNFPDWEEKKLSSFLCEHKLKSAGDEAVFSVSVHKGLVNQIEHLGRSFSAKNTNHYNRVQYGDVVYTKSPTGDFPLGIIKQSTIKEDVIVSPLYGVFTPETPYLGYWLHTYFLSSINTGNYLKPIIQKGAKNTINITNKTFLSNKLKVPIVLEEQKLIADFLLVIDEKIDHTTEQLALAKAFKKGLLQQMFV